MTELTLDHGGQFVVLVRQRGFQIERNNGRTRMARGFDVIVNPVQVVFILAKQQYGCSVCRIGFRGSFADAAAGSRNQNGAPSEQVGAGGILEHRMPLESMVGGARTNVRRTIRLGRFALPPFQQLHSALSRTCRSSSGWSTTTSAPQFPGLSSG